ncbi:MAG: methyltransferase domain-containing protein [Fimbriimonas sp.]|nr:methyltransferase domain-containing protein [Fimbriimonas sp.]
MKKLVPSLIVPCFLVFGLALAAQSSHPPYVKMSDHDPDGIGVSYLGREIAQVMGHEAADWLDRPEREAEEAPSMLVKSLKLQPGMTVADIGAGSGYLSFMMAKYVGSNGKVYAEDIQPEMLDIVKQKAKEAGVKTVIPWLGTTIDPKLPAKSVDLMIMVDVYHEFDKPYEMISNMVPALKKGGRLVFVEYRKEDPSVPIKEVHKMSVAQVRKEMAIFPLDYRETSEVLPRQHIIVFVRR